MTLVGFLHTQQSPHLASDISQNDVIVRYQSQAGGMMYVHNSILLS